MKILILSDAKPESQNRKIVLDQASDRAVPRKLKDRNEIYIYNSVRNDDAMSNHRSTREKNFDDVIP